MVYIPDTISTYVIVWNVPTSIVLQLPTYKSDSSIKLGLIHLVPVFQRLDIFFNGSVFIITFEINLREFFRTKSVFYSLSPEPELIKRAKTGLTSTSCQHIGPVWPDTFGKLPKIVRITHFVAIHFHPHYVFYKRYIM
jgi:hypothetical protein